MEKVSDPSGLIRKNQSGGVAITPAPRFFQKNQTSNIHVFISMFDTKNDLIRVADTPEPVTLKRPNSSYQAIINNAFVRVSRRTSYVTPGAANTVPTASATWFLPWSELPDRPKDGDEIVTTRDQTWTIYKITPSYIHRHWRCLTRMLYLSYEANESVRIFRPIANSSGTGVFWQIMGDFNVKFSQHQELVNTKKEGLPSEETIRIHFKDNPHLQKEDLLLTTEGVFYRIRRIRYSRQTYGWTEVFAEKTEWS